MTSAVQGGFTVKKALAAGLMAVMGLFSLLPQSSRAESIPPEASVQGVIGHAQSYILSCESRSAADWSASFGSPLTEYDILAAIPRTDNPETGFVGSPSGAFGYIPPHSYGVYPPPLASVLRGMGIPAQAEQGFGWDALRQEIAAARPVIVWVIGQMWNGKPIRYAPADGPVTTVAYYEHTMILVGYSQQAVHMVDAYTGNDQFYDIQTFLTSYAVLGQRAIVYAGDAPATRQPPTASGEVVTVQRGDSLGRIASRFGLAWPDLAALNHLDYPYLIYAGQQLQIPGEPAAEPTETSLPSPTPTASLTPIPTPTAQASPTAQALKVIVQAGDTLFKIAYRYQVSWPDLVQANQLVYPYTIYPGEELLLPGTVALPSATAMVQPTATARPEDEYIVQRGDYLTDLAVRFNLDWRNLAEINSIPWPYKIYPGQVLRLR